MPQTFSFSNNMYTYVCSSHLVVLVNIVLHVLMGMTHTMSHAIAVSMTHNDVVTHEINCGMHIFSN